MRSAFRVGLGLLVVAGIGCTHQSETERPGHITGTLVADAAVYAPQSGTVLVLDGGGRVVVQATADASGRFDAKVGPGSYQVGGKTKAGAACQPKTVQVVADQTVEVQVTGPPGIGCGEKPGA